MITSRSSWKCTSALVVFGVPRRSIQHTATQYTGKSSYTDAAGRKLILHVYETYRETGGAKRSNWKTITSGNVVNKFTVFAHHFLTYIEHVTSRQSCNRCCSKGRKFPSFLHISFSIATEHNSFQQAYFTRCYFINVIKPSSHLSVVLFFSCTPKVTCLNSAEVAVIYQTQIVRTCRRCQ